jgi:hypothetical protein
VSGVVLWMRNPKQRLPTGVSAIPASLPTGDGAHDPKRLRPRCDRVRQRALPAAHGTGPVRRVSGQEAQLSTVSPGTAARSPSMATTVQLPKVSAMAAIIMSF